jgi:hypothetical protein
MTSRLFHCSKCGEEGHTKRNNNCRVNIEEKERFQIMNEKILSIRNMNWQITNILDQRDGLVLPLEEMILSCLLMLQYVCSSIKDILVVKYSVASLTIHLESNVRKLNRILMIHQEQNPTAFYDLGAIQLNYIPYPSILCRPVYLLEPINSYFTIPGNILTSSIVRQLIRPQTIDTVMNPTKRTIKYLKEITIEYDQKKDSPTDETPDMCPICLTAIEPKQSIYTKCNHRFCADCIKNLATSIKNNTSSPACPLCRSHITKLVTENHELCVEIRNHLDSL